MFWLRRNTFWRVVLALDQGVIQTGHAMALSVTAMVAEGRLRLEQPLQVAASGAAGECEHHRATEPGHNAPFSTYRTSQRKQVELFEPTRGDPQIEINPVAVAARGVAAATLGIVLKPFTALAGAATDEEPSPCARLLAQDSGG